MVASVIKAAAPESSLTKYLQMLCSICTVAVIALPIYSALTDKNEIANFFESIEFETESTESYEEIYNTYLINGELENAERVLSESLCKAVGAGSGTVEVRLEGEYGEGEIRVVGADALVHKGAIAVSPDKIKTYIKDTLRVECRIIYLFNDEKSK